MMFLKFILTIIRNRNELWWGSNTELVKKPNPIFKRATLVLDDRFNSIEKVDRSDANIVGENEEIKNIFIGSHKVKNKRIKGIRSNNSWSIKNII